MGIAGAAQSATVSTLSRRHRYDAVALPDEAVGADAGLLCRRPHLAHSRTRDRHGSILVEPRSGRASSREFGG